MSQIITSLKPLNKFLKVTSLSSKKEEVKSKSSSSGLRDNRNENVIENLVVKNILYIDDFFFMLGHQSHSTDEYLFLTKGNEIKDHFKFHTETVALKKVVLKEAKLIISLGYDALPYDEEETKTPDYRDRGNNKRRKVIKVWNYQSLIMSEYDDYMNYGLTGGIEPGLQSPRMIFIDEKIDSFPIDGVGISICGAYIGVIQSRDEITIHKAFPNFSISNDKSIKARTIKFGMKTSNSHILGLHFYKDKNTNNNYLYAAASDMIYLIDIEKQSGEIKELSLSEMSVIPRCIDCDPESGNLLVSQNYYSDENIPSMGEAIYHLDDNPILKFCSEGNRIFAKLYGKLMVIVTEKDGIKKHYLEVYDHNISILYYSCSYEKIEDIIVDNNSIFLFVTHETKDGVPQKELIKLNEITVGEKIKILLEKSLFKEAEMVAVNAECSEEIKAAVAREQGDHYYNNLKYKEAMSHYIKTIGYEAPSYVIEKYLDVQNLDLLIEYLEKLIETPITKNNNLLGNNKDYTALLLNCYLKQQKKEKIQEQINKDRGTDSIFDVDTAIDVCRQKPGYTDLAVNLAQRYEKWEILVSIYIEDENQNIPEAISIIDEKIKDVKAKIKLLQQYGTQLLNPKSEVKFIGDAGVKFGKERKALELLIKITNFLIGRSKNPEFTSAEYVNYVLDSSKTIKMSELIKIFVDQNSLLETYLSHIIEKHKDDARKITGGEFDIYHKLLECYLNEYAENKTNKFSSSLQSVEKKIEDFIKLYEAKIDKNYVLYLFRFYGYLEGIKKLCQQMNMNQELLSVYMEKNEADNIIKLCVDKGAEEKDLWIQSLNYFREQGEDDKLKECMLYIGQKDILSPLMVLDIIHNTNSDLKFKYIKDYMLSEIK